jgi:hypothetical protein
MIAKLLFELFGSGGTLPPFGDIVAVVIVIPAI